MITKKSLLIAISFLAALTGQAANPSSGCAAYREAALSSRQEWAAALAGLLIERNRQRHDRLSPRYPDMTNCLTGKRTMAEWWGLRSREDLLESLAWIEGGGHRQGFDRISRGIRSLTSMEYRDQLRSIPPDSEYRAQVEVVRKHWAEVGDKSILAWDYGRYVYLVRHGYMEGYLTEKEAWDKIMPVAERMQKTFSSWEEFGRNYIIGREFWSPSIAQREQEMYGEIFAAMLNGLFSPWQRRPWNTDLKDGSNERPGMSSDAAAQEAETLVRKGVAYGESGAWENAAAEFRKAISADPQYVIAYSGLADAYMYMKRYPEAVAVCDEGIAKNPDQPYLHMTRGTACWRRDRKFTDVVGNEFVRAIDLDPGVAEQMPRDTWGFDRHFYRRAGAAFHAKNYTQAINDFSVAIRINPRMEPAYYNLACCYALSGEPDKVLKPLALSIELNPSFRKEAAADKDFLSMKYNRKFCALVGIKCALDRIYYLVAAGILILAALCLFLLQKRVVQAAMKMRKSHWFKRNDREPAPFQNTRISGKRSIDLQTDAVPKNVQMNRWGREAAESTCFLTKGKSMIDLLSTPGTKQNSDAISFALLSAALIYLCSPLSSTAYKLICNLIRVVPFAVTLVLLYFLPIKRRVLKYLAVLVIGHVVTVIFTQMYWDYAIDYAPTSAISDELASKDGASRVFVSFIGWIYILVFMVIAEGFRYLVRKTVEMIGTMIPGKKAADEDGQNLTS